jgi:hypothetical protein
MDGRRSALLLLCTGLFATSVSGEMLYAVLAGSPNSFGTVNTTTGVFTLIGAQTTNLFGMGFAPNGTLYATDDALIPGAGVWEVDPFSGGLTSLGSVSDSTDGSTVGSDGLIYAVDQNPTSAEFYTIDPNTLAVNMINSSLGFESDGLAVFANGTFYTDAVNGESDILEAVDPSTGIATPVGSGLGVELFSGVNVNGTIYGAGGNGNLYTIDLNTGVATMDVAITGGSGDVDALAFSSAPEPSTAALAGCGIALAGLVSMIRRSRRNSFTGLAR